MTRDEAILKARCAIANLALSTDGKSLLRSEQIVACLEALGLLSLETPSRRARRLSRPCPVISLPTARADGKLR